MLIRLFILTVLTSTAFLNSAFAMDWSGFQWSVSDGWKNQGSEFDCTWSSGNIWKENDLLILHAKHDNGFKTCSEMRTHAYMRKGRYEVEMQAGSVPGTISSFFTYAGDSGSASHYEVDIELMGGTNLLHTNIWIKGQQSPVDIDLGRYGLSIWNLEKYAFSIDDYGVTWEVFSRNSNSWIQVRRANAQVSSYMQLFINNWISANRYFPPSTYNWLPVYAKYRSVKVTPWE
ncbi:family 16 glycosylhydrolase [Vibrio navarrensis]|uniref:family 16 glycosylhydrolase n=1 Tax=Vibrio navarrensis TaxID=29495 RepID=UPI00186A26AA|nr:family 16 glycosylhydrolase [Vibrio navarrensis]EJK2113255.1 family 16 glycosylhydrolase [Vibrio navarrensis]MBE4601401.1 hypothetical protein [Vibrio navarrensis]